jgi:predicted Zn finger-like uncharacterized protein
MILTCPACATSYFIPDGAVPAQGRKVRCQSCGETWRAAPDDEVLELTPAAEPADEPDTLAETPAPELPKAFRARAEQQRRLRRAAAHGAVWAGMASVFLGLLGAAWLFRVEVVQAMPRAAAAYAAVGAPVNAAGLDFEAVRARALPHDPGKVLVSGALRNVRDREVTAPPVRVALLDEHGAEIGFKIVRIDAAPVLPGGVQGFAAVIADPGGRGAGVGVDFAVGDQPPAHRALSNGSHAPAADGHAESSHGEDAHAAPEAHAPAPAAHAAEAHAAPAHEPAHAAPPAAAEHGGLRPALAPASALRPVEATPVDDHHG